MDKRTQLTEIVIDHDSLSISFVEICQHYAISEELLFEMLEYGLLPDIVSPNKESTFTQAHLQRIISAFRLHKDLEINTQGVILALELMDELAEVRKHLSLLQRHMKNS